MSFNLFPYKLLIYADVSSRDATTGKFTTTTVIIADTVCNYQYTNSFTLTSDFLGTNYAYVNAPYTLVPEGDLTDIDTEVFPQFAEIFDGGSTISAIDMGIEIDFAGYSGAKREGVIIKSEHAKIGTMQGYEVGSTFWVELNE